jgi:manganese/zinc/iron transport system permease protein
MESLWSLLSDYTFQVVALGSALMGVISGVMGSFAVLRKQSLLGDGVSHAALPGVVTAFLLTGSKQTEVLLTGALISGLMATLLMVNIVRHSRVKFDGALALVMSVFFGLGLVLLTYVQKQPNANQAGLNRFIFGQASTLLRRDLAIRRAARSPF